MCYQLNIQWIMLSSFSMEIVILEIMYEYITQVKASFTLLISVENSANFFLIIIKHYNNQDISSRSIHIFDWYSF